jgi:hypothetical protein
LVVSNPNQFTPVSRGAVEQLVQGPGAPPTELPPAELDPPPDEDPPAPLPPDGEVEGPAPEQPERRKTSVRETVQLERIRIGEEVVKRKVLPG